MFTCFLFIQTADLSSILSLRLDAQGQLDAPLERRSIAEIQALQEHAKTIIVLSAVWCGIHQVELPLLSETKARAAIPFALEDHLAQPVTHLHFGIDKAHYRDGRYQVVVIEKEMMRTLMASLSELGLNYDQITLDWFALLPGEGVLGEEAVLIYAPDFQGALSSDIWTHCYPVAQADLQWYQFPESKLSHATLSPSELTSSLYSWFAQRLFKTKILNLCQGEFQHATRQTQVKTTYLKVGVLAGIAFSLFVGIHFGLYAYLNAYSKKLDTQIAQVYRLFFPGAKQIISPKIRIEQLIKQNQLGQNTSLWSLLESWSLALNKTTQATKSSQPSVQTLAFQNQVLTVMFRCENFAALERIEAFLRNRHVHVQQISAATENDQVVAKLELS